MEAPGRTADRAGRPTVATIDASALRANLVRLRAALPEGVALLATVKADAYGHGATLVAPVLARAGVDFFGVATVEEGIELRVAGIAEPVLVLTGASRAEAALAADNDLAVAVLDAANATDLAGGLDGRRLRVHVKLDTGMTRLGATPEALPELIGALRSAPRLEVEGVFSHFADADSVDTVYTERQARCFRAGVEALSAAGFAPRWTHLANSVAALSRPGGCGNLVRPGIVLYGAGPGEDPANEGWKPVMQLQTRVWQVKSVPAERPISYGQTFVTRRPSRIAVLPIGYADGYARALSNRAEVLIRGRRAPVVGRVCMDLTMVDVTDVHGVAPGDEVVLWGRQGSVALSVNEVARWQDSISYEVLTRVGRRVPRVLVAGAEAAERG